MCCDCFGLYCVSIWSVVRSKWNVLCIGLCPTVSIFILMVKSRIRLYWFYQSPLAECPHLPALFVGHQSFSVWFNAHEHRCLMPYKDYHTISADDHPWNLSTVGSQLVCSILCLQSRIDHHWLSCFAKGLFDSFRALCMQHAEHS